jgi:hypothetical protein
LLNFRESISTITLITTTLLVTSCGNKPIQCKAILEITRKADLITETAKTGNREELINIAKGLDQLATELEALNAGDDRLGLYQVSFVKSYRDISQALRSTVAAIDRPASDTVSSALNSLERATSRNQILVENMRTLCPSQ